MKKGYLISKQQGFNEAIRGPGCNNWPCTDGTNPCEGLEKVQKCQGGFRRIEKEAALIGY